MDREVGFYQLQFKDGEWIVAEWNGKGWLIPGSRVAFSFEGLLNQIGPRVELPSVRLT